MNCDDYSLSSFGVFLSLASDNFLISMSWSVLSWETEGTFCRSLYAVLSLLVLCFLNSSYLGFPDCQFWPSTQSHCWAPSLSPSQCRSLETLQAVNWGNLRLSPISQSSLSFIAWRQYLESYWFIYLVQFLIVLERRINLVPVTPLWLEVKIRKPVLQTLKICHRHFLFLKYD